MDKLTTGPGSIVLPLALGAASAFSRRIGAGVGAMLSTMDLLQQRGKQQQKEEAWKTYQPTMASGDLTPTSVPPEIMSTVGPMLLSNQLHTKAEAERPVLHFGEIEGKPSAITGTSRGPFTVTPLGGERPPNYTPDMDAWALSTYGKPFNKLAPEEAGGYHQWQENKAIGREQRSMDLWTEKQKILQDNAANKSEAAQKNQIDTVTQRAARGEWGKIVAQQKVNDASLERWYRSAKNDPNITMYKEGSAKRSEMEGSLKRQYEEGKAKIRDDFQADAEGWHSQYGDLGFKDMGINSPHAKKVLGGAPAPAVQQPGPQKVAPPQAAERGVYGINKRTGQRGYFKNGMFTPE